MGVDEETRRSHDIDQMNAALRSKMQSRTYHQVLLDHANAHQQVLAALAGLTNADLRRPYRYFQPGEFASNDAPIIGWILGNTAEHYEEHLIWLRSLVKASIA